MDITYDTQVNGEDVVVEGELLPPQPSVGIMDYEFHMSSVTRVKDNVNVIESLSEKEKNIISDYVIDLYGE